MLLLRWFTFATSPALFKAWPKGEQIKSNQTEEV